MARLLQMTLAAMVLLGTSCVAQAQDAPSPPERPARGAGSASGGGGAGGAGAAGRSTSNEPPMMPAASVTHHTLELPGGRTLRFTATARALRLRDKDRVPQADVVVVAYTLDGADPTHRPVTFAINGGPGSSSAWLQFGALGPWRLPMDGAGATPSAPPVVAPNTETWLDFTDLVFIDPPGTGFSKILGTGSAAEDARKHFYSVNGDIEGLAEVVRRWLVEAGRATSPKFIVGESYGGFRGPRLVRSLQTGQGIGIDGLVLISPVLDFDQLNGDDAFQPLWWAGHLPSMVAAAREARGPVDKAAMADVEAYAGGEYLTDMVRGLQDEAAVARVSERVASLTGLDPALVREHAGRIDYPTWLRARWRAQGRAASAYDTTVTSADPFPESTSSRFPDPQVDALRGPVTSAALDVYARELKWIPEGEFELLSQAVARAWDYGRGRNPESTSALRAALALDPRLHLLVAHGLTDVVTPYFTTQMELNQIPPTVTADRTRFLVLPGGHMFYVRDASRQAFRTAAMALYPAGP